MAKAYDSVNHDILLDKLCCYGIHSSALLWFTSYLENRSKELRYSIMNSVKLLQVGKQ